MTRPPGSMSATLREFAEAGFLNLVGGCCGTTPAHIEAIAGAVADVPPRSPPAIERRTRLSGLETLNLGPDSLFANIGERTNVTGSARFRKLIQDDDLEAALAVARQQVDSGAQLIDVNMDEGLLDSEAAMDRFLKLIASEPDISRVPIVIDSSKWSVIEAGLKCVQGKGIVNSISPQGGRGGVPRSGPAGPSLRRRGDRDGLRRARTGGHLRAESRNLPSGAPNPHRGRGLPIGGHHLRSQHLRRRDGDRRAQPVRDRVRRSLSGSEERVAPLQGQRGA